EQRRRQAQRELAEAEQRSAGGHQMAEESSAQIDHPARQLRHAFLEDRAHGEPREILVPTEPERAQMREAQISPDGDDEDECPPIARETPNITGGATGSSSLTQHFSYHPKAVPTSLSASFVGIAFARSRPPGDGVGCGEPTAWCPFDARIGADATRIARWEVFVFAIRTLQRRTSASAVAQ